MKVAHGNAPVSDAAASIAGSDLGKDLFSLFVFEGVQPCHSLIQLSLNFRRTGCAEVDVAEFG